jgi:hypothetical protein
VKTDAFFIIFNGFDTLLVEKPEVRGLVRQQVRVTKASALPRLGTTIDESLNNQQDRFQDGWRYPAMSWAEPT